MPRTTEPLFAVTHCHTRQSRNRASPMDGYIRSAVERVTGESADEFDWSESLTRAEDLHRVLEQGGRDQRVDLLFVTDHVNETTRELDPDLVALAATDGRVLLGAEVQTVAEDPPGSGRFAAAPEMLLYGGPDRVRSPGGRHFGVNAETLLDLHRRCRVAGEEKPELCRLLSYCREHRIAHALAHPLDGHFASLPTVLLALSSCRFPEVVNGGFSGASARRLHRYIRVHNALTGSGGSGSIPSEACPPPPSENPRRLAGWLAERLSIAGTDGVPPTSIPWGGSDAHLGDYGRVRIAYRATRRGAGIPEMLAEMLDTPGRRLLEEEAFTIVGRGTRLGSCLAEVLRLVGQNARRNRATFRGPRRTARLAVIGPWLAIRKVLRHRIHQERLGRGLDRVLDEAERLASPSAG